MSTKWMEGMNGPAMDQWVADLRSEEFAQTVGTLRCAAGFCCLGVATDRNAGACGLIINESPYGRFTYSDGDQNYGSLMPESVMDHLGIPTRYRLNVVRDGSFMVQADTDDVSEFHLSQDYRSIDGRAMVDIVCLNDSVGKSFSEIADRIEMTFKVETES